MVDDAEAVDFLRRADIEIVGRMPWSSNVTLLCELELDGVEGRAVYKPRKGERPLWDFPDGLDRREVAAYELSRALRWQVIPPTVLRDGPLDMGSLQWFVDADFDQHYFTLLEDAANHDQLRRMCAFDFVANNTDRKGGHCLVDADGHIWGIDNGLSFHAEFKLRTVIWDFAGEPVPDEIREDLLGFVASETPAGLAELLNVFEIDAMKTRARALAENGCFPVDDSGRRFPWPLV